MVPVDCAAVFSTPLTVVLADWSKLARWWLAAFDQAETASFCAVVLPLEDRPDRLTPHVSSPVREIRGAANPAMTPKPQCSQSRTLRAAAMASFHPSSVPLRAMLGGDAGRNRQLKVAALGSAQNPAIRADENRIGQALDSVPAGFSDDQDFGFGV